MAIDMIAMIHMKTNFLGYRPLEMSFADNGKMFNLYGTLKLGDTKAMQKLTEDREVLSSQRPCMNCRGRRCLRFHFLRSTSLDLLC